MRTARRVLVFGRTGQLGRELSRARWPAATEVISLGRAEADLARPEELADAVAGADPSLVVIAAAYTAVDRAEAEPALAQAVNAEAPGVIATAAAARGIPVIHVSTDYVFDGTQPGWYSEADPVAPLGIYGASKEEGEQRVRTANPQHVILRTAWVYSPFGSNFIKTMVRLAGERDAVSVVQDQVGCPTAAGDLAQAVVAIADAITDGWTDYGTYHAAGAEEASWHSFAEAAFRELEKRGKKRPQNRPIPTSDYPTPARRPANSRLSGNKLAARLGLRLPSWQEALPRVMDELLQPTLERHGT